MINIIPRPNNLIDYNHRKYIKSFKILCDEEFSDALSLFAEEYCDFIDFESDFTILVTKVDNNNKQAYNLDVLKKELL